MLKLDKQVIYNLKRRHGKPIQVYHATFQTNPATGVQTSTTTYTVVNKAIVDKQLINKITYYVQNQDKFKEGAAFKVNDIIIAIDKSDLDTITEEYNIIYNNLEYEIKKVFDNEDFWVVHMRRTQNQSSIIHISRGHSIAIEQEVSNE